MANASSCVTPARATKLQSKISVVLEAVTPVSAIGSGRSCIMVPGLPWSLAYKGSVLEGEDKKSRTSEGLA